MKILLTNTICLHGGVESHLAGLVRALVRAGHQPVLYFYEAGPALGSYSAICEVHAGPETSVGEVIVRGRFDLVHAQIGCFRRGLARAMAVAGYRGPVVGSCHGWVPNAPIVLDNPTVWTSVSESARDRLRRSSGMDSVVVYNGVDLSQFDPSGPYNDSDEPVALWVGRTGDWSKDHPGFAAVASRLVERGWRVCVVDGAPDGLHATLRDWLGDRVTYLRGLSASEMARAYRTAAMSGGCLISTSASEAFGLALLEAMACGCPVVAPRIGGIPEVVEDGVSGLLYDRGSNACERAVELAEVLRGPVRQAIVEAGLARARYFSEDRMAHEYERIYLSLVGRGGRAYDPVRRNLAAAAIRIRRYLRAGRKAARCGIWSASLADQ
ncbi:MAG: glycosyltransferase family 4 protein [Armatimonadota bacterium]